MSILRQHTIYVPAAQEREILELLRRAGAITGKADSDPGRIALSDPEGGLVLVDRAEAHWRMHQINAHLERAGVTPAIRRPEYPSREWSEQMMALATIEFDWADCSPSPRFRGGQAEWRGRISDEYGAVFRTGEGEEDR